MSKSAALQADQVNAAVNVVRRLPPHQINKNIVGIARLAPNVLDDLLSKVDRPLEIRRDNEANRWYVLSDFNRDGDSYRSPWSNQYQPPPKDPEGAFFPSEHMRKLETEYNAIFDAYRHAYYEGGVSSVYLWDHQEEGTMWGAFLIKKELERVGDVDKGSWDSIHLMEVRDNNNQTTYHLSSTVILCLEVADGGDASTAQEPVMLSGYITKQVEENKKFSNESMHLVHIGAMIENAENNFRKQLEQVHFNKTREILNQTRRYEPEKDCLRTSAFQNDLSKAVAAKQADLQKQLAARMPLKRLV